MDLNTLLEITECADIETYYEKIDKFMRGGEYSKGISHFNGLDREDKYSYIYHVLNDAESMDTDKLMKIIRSI